MNSASYPRHAAGIPEWTHRQGAYECRFARTHRDLDAVERLRYDVFNRELGEGLRESAASARDEDAFDATSHHLMVTHVETGDVVGTYRLLTHELVADRNGFYSESEFDLSVLPPVVLEAGVELGRACVGRGHRGQRILKLLWMGIAAYIAHNGKRFLFGCASMPDCSDASAAAATAALRNAGHMHPTLEVKPRPGFETGPTPPAAGGANLPSLLRAYIALGTRVCSAPARDRAFGTIDYFILLDVEGMAPETRAAYDA